MKKQGFWARVVGEDVESLLLVTFVEDNVVEIDSFRGREKVYFMEAPRLGMVRKQLKRIGENGARFQVC